MADFQSGLISWVFGLFSSGFLHRTTVNDCRIDFDMFFEMLIFDPKWGFCMAYSPCIMAYFQNCLISRIFGGFFSGIFHRATVNDL